MSIAVLVALYVAGMLVAAWAAQRRGYWWPLGAGLGIAVGPAAPVVMFLLPDRRRRRRRGV
ncbi:MAG TPA: hypothetical protein VNL92_02760 [Dehalococcoidia bacterium]|nr:hypothetical protein [Dehalococcoidia bacterium]